jgi:Na+/H+-dicarboxylate symporter
MKKVLGRMGQSTLEYVIVLTAIVAAILFAAANLIRPNVNKLYGDAGAKIGATGTVFSNSVGMPNTGGATGGATGGSTGGTTGGTGIGF